MENESTVLILVGHFFSASTYDSIVAKLPKESYVQHHEFCQNNQGAFEFVKDQLRKSKKPSKKFLICDWTSSAGYEAPAVIFVLGSKSDQGIEN